MGSHFQAICQCAILLVTIFTAIGALQIQGRPLNPTTKQELKPHFPATSLRTGLGESDVEKKDDFRPTTPGNSPGVGHHFVEGSGTAAGGRSVHYVKGLKDDFRPTTPGHSPGIGHALHRVASEPRA